MMAAAAKPAVQPNAPDRPMTSKRQVFFLSDRTGITAETLGNSLLSQFDAVEFRRTTLPFINSPDKARATVEFINVATQEKQPAIIFSTTVNDEIRALLRQANGVFFDPFDSYLPQLEQELQAKSVHVEGRAHGMPDRGRYESRIDAMNFTLHHDDGQTQKGLERADVILLAPSRCGKTPTCLYMALQHGLFCANYPLTDEELEIGNLPAHILKHKDKLYGLTSDADRLHQIRSERRPGSRYASLAQCGFELRQAEQLYRRFSVPCLDSSNMSIEEIATVIMQDKGLRRGGQ